MTFDPHPPRVVRARQGAAAADDQGAEARGASPTPACRARRSSASRLELSRWDPETFVRTVLVDWLRVAEVWVGANFLFGHDRTGNFSLLRTLGSPLRVQGREDRSGPLQGLRRQQHAHPPADQRRARGRGGRAARPSVLHRRPRRARRPARPDASAFRPPTSAPRTSCCRRTASTRRPSRSTAIVRAVGDQRRGPADRRRVRDARPSRPHIFDLDRDLYGADGPRRLRAAPARRAGVRVARPAARRRSPPTARGRACCSVAFRCRITRGVRLPISSSRSSRRAETALDGMLPRGGRRRVFRHLGLRRGRPSTT